MSNLAEMSRDSLDAIVFDDASTVEEWKAAMAEMSRRDQAWLAARRVAIESGQIEGHESL